MTRLVSLIAAVLVATLIAGSTSSITSVASAAPGAKKCGISGKERTFGPTYVLEVRVTQVTCAAAFKVIRAFHTCRYKNGRKGFCRTLVSGYRCTERRTQQIPTQYDSATTCKKGTQLVYHYYCLLYTSPSPRDS